MASNSFGTLFKITTWGESHGRAIGVVIDGCPAGLSLSNEEINAALAKRAPGKNAYTSPRNEADVAEIYAGVFEGKTTGAPISIIIPNTNADPSKYEPIKHLLRPGHANFTYLEKYGCFDHRGGGRASARETACRVAASVVAKKILDYENVSVLTYIKEIGGIVADVNPIEIDTLQKNIDDSPVNCPDHQAAKKIMAAIDSAKSVGDSLGGIVECSVIDCPVGLGDPVYEKLEANLAKAMLTLPATKGFEIGEGFACARMTGAEHNDSFQVTDDGRAEPATNHAGGTLGGISTGKPLVFRVAFKPTSSIKQDQKTVDLDGKTQDFQLPPGSRHDPCVAIRAVPIVEAMCAIVLADAMLMNRCIKC